MLPDRMTLSLCPVCYERIPAAISGVTMHKVCPEHGAFTAQV